MQIDGTKPVSSKTGIKKTKGTNATSFTLGVEETKISGNVNSTSQSHSINALLLQNIESNDPDIIKKRGEQLLGYLEDLQKGFLSNQMSKGTLELMLDTIKAQQGHCDNPQLMHTLEMIEQRASIELAKLNYV